MTELLNANPWKPGIYWVIEKFRPDWRWGRYYCGQTLFRSRRGGRHIFKYLNESNRFEPVFFESEKEAHRMQEECRDAGIHCYVKRYEVK